MNDTTLSNRIRDRIDTFADAAAHDLGLPKTFVQAQLDFAASAVETIGRIDPTRHQAEVAFLFPGNTEGGMALYMIAKARSLGWSVRAKISTRAPDIHAAIADCFSDIDGVTVQSTPGPAFLHSALRDGQVGYVQVFGDDAWIDAYRPDVWGARKPVAFDGPGKDALLVLDGADVSAAVDAAVDLGLFAGGAACMSAERFFVHEGIAMEFEERLVARLSEISPTPPWEGDSILGLAASRRAVDRMSQQIRTALCAGARLVLGDSEVKEVISPSGKTFFACAPTVLVDVPTSAEILQSETFGPVFPIVTFKGGPADGVKLVEDSQYGLTATVFGPADDANRTAEILRTSHAITYANSTMLNAFRPEFWGSGGFKKSGWVWRINPATNSLTVRHGFRTLDDELHHAAVVDQG